MTTILTIIACVAALAAVLMQYKRDLMMLQQNSYREDRYRRWIKESGDNTRYDKLIGLAAFLISLLPRVSTGIDMAVVAVFCIWNFIRLAAKKYKKPLVFTNRAKRIYFTAIGLTVVLFVIPLFVLDDKGFDHIAGMAARYLLFAYCVSDVVLIWANWLLRPVEKHINQKYYDEAASMLKSMPDLKIIGITGSYGKTSTKHYLFRILTEKYDVLMTPGNFNTTLGVIRTVREQLKPYNQVFIVEMGAKQTNDIKEICDLVHPTMGIVTAVGPQHLESFKTIENVQKTKFELVDSLPSDGVAIINDDFEYIANRKVDNCECLRYAIGREKGADFYAADISYDANGTNFTICDHSGEMITLHTSLVGKCNISNLMAAVIAALKLGVEKEKIKYAVERIKQVEHRLNITRTAGGITIIDDAYNSNPVGAEMALDVLSGMKTGKRIIITPGMIELGDEQYALNCEFGAKIPAAADIAIIVGEYNREAILDGIKHAGMDMANVHEAATFPQAQQLMLSLAKPGDTVLYENDLPDTFK